MLQLMSIYRAVGFLELDIRKSFQLFKDVAESPHTRLSDSVKIYAQYIQLLLVSFFEPEGGDVSPKRQVFSELHSVKTRKTFLLIVSAVKTSNRTYTEVSGNREPKKHWT